MKEYPIMNDPVFLTAKAFSILHPGIEYDAYWVEIEPDENGEPRYGFTIFTDNGCIPQIFISAELNPTQAAEIFGHELAHVVAGPGADHGEAWENEFEAIFQKCIEISDALFSKEDETMNDFSSSLHRGSIIQANEYAPEDEEQIE